MKRLERRTMKKQLPYFYIGDSFGGNQDWFHNVVMHMGGCAAATACDSCIYFQQNGMLDKVYPFDIQNLNEKDYEAFAMQMKPFLRPRVGGVSRLEMYIDGFDKFLKSRSSGIEMQPFDGDKSFGEARQFVRGQINQGYPVPYLMLKHRSEKLKDFVWHWFLLVGYEDREDDIIVTTATYGDNLTFSLREMWNTGFEQKGGMIRYRIKA